MIRSSPLCLATLLLTALLSACSGADHAQRDTQLVGAPPPEQPVFVPDREPVVLIVYDISEEDEALLEEERRAYEEANPPEEEEEVTTTTTTTVEEEGYGVTVQQGANTGYGIPWSGGPVPDGYEGPISQP